MSSDGLLGTRKDAPVESATRLLQDKWPALVVLTPESIGLPGDQGATLEFLAIVQSLSDAGFLSYEALVINADGPVVVDAALTARGRAALAARVTATH
ncbi:hypothetical protein ACNFJ7_06500 [Sphingomonas sp. HT-1]|jgi:hypothetical protein|uniref:hypothetical protein n=1 Tax=unclassified Sphingomonas TaxID=196159 RepID=UPI0002E24714|nr:MULTISPECIES: hypothetical protein [unclassified Sphingomonas]KTF67718.1 hypothetical protein ATB93_17010 [Sphingomonas sp. WG]